MSLKRAMNNGDEQKIDKIIRLMQRDDSVDAPEDSVRWAKNLFRTRAAEPSRPLVEKIRAVLQMNLTPDRAAFGERSASAARQMLFSAGASGVDLRIAKAGQKFTLTGQILGEDFAGAEVILAGGGAVLETRAGEFGEFRFEALVQGKFHLSLIKDDKEIIIEDLEID